MIGLRIAGSGAEADLSLATVSNETSTHVLVVDDNAGDRNLVRLSLMESPHSYKLECAERLSEGLEKLGKQHPDVVLLDLNLPDSQGNETVRRVMHQAPCVPILVLTGADDDCMALDAVRTGAQDYIVKGQLDSTVLTRAMRYAIERHQLLVTLRETRQKQLEFKDKFLSHVSHELRSPLSCIHQYVEVMLEGLAGPLTSKEREYLGGVLRSARQLNKLINDLLDAARANVGKLTIEAARVQPCELIKHLGKGFGVKAKCQGVRLTTRVAPGTPPVLADGCRLQQIVTNLLDNALKFTDAGGEISVQAGVFPEDPEFVQFTVRDTGRGIQPENLERIFDRLYQEQNAVASRQGLGLGLAICKELVERQGGRIWVKSKPGQGSVFSFVLPRFSLPATVSPVLIREGKVPVATIVAVEIMRSEHTGKGEMWEFTRRRCREIVERCMLPDKDLVLPSMHAMERRETVFVLACADRDGAAVLENRIRGQLNAAPQIADSCTHRTFCIPLPGVPVEIGPIDKQLEWISERIESAVLQACTA